MKKEAARRIVRKLKATGWTLLSLADELLGMLDEESSIESRPMQEAFPFQRRKAKLFTQFLEYWDGNVGRAKAEMLKATNGRGSQDWTEEDLLRLEARLDGYVREECGEYVPEEVE